MHFNFAAASAAVCFGRSALSYLVGKKSSHSKTKASNECSLFIIIWLIRRRWQPGMSSHCSEENASLSHLSLTFYFSKCISQMHGCFCRCDRQKKKLRIISLQCSKGKCEALAGCVTTPGLAYLLSQTGAEESLHLISFFINTFHQTLTSSNMLSRWMHKQRLLLGICRFRTAMVQMCKV